MKSAIIILMLSMSLMSLGKGKEFIHPSAFKNITSWMSDIESPYITSFSITAVKANRNQFDYDKVIIKDNSYVYYEGEESMGYSQKVVDGKYVINFWYNGGGSLTTGYVIVGEIIKKKISNKEIEIFNLLEYEAK